MHPACSVAAAAAGWLAPLRLAALNAAHPAPRLAGGFRPGHDPGRTVYVGQLRYGAQEQHPPVAVPRAFGLPVPLPTNALP